MSRTVTALYDSRAEAEAARQRLSSEVDVNSVRIIDKNSGGSGQSGGLNNVYMSNDDRHAYGEGLRRGGFLLCAEVGSDEDADRIVRLLEESASVDLDERQQSWRREGWQPQAAGGSTGGAIGSGQSSRLQAGGSVVEEQRIPVVEEELRVGKREVTRGGARVRSYVREVPVHEQVTLREEHVNVERRPVDQAASATGAGSGAEFLQERTIEMRETAEEAVVQKVANVREEVVVSKIAEERTEQIEDTVRRTEVEVDENGGRRNSAFGGFSNRDDQSFETCGSESERERDRSR
ncbi:MAG TPA: YsnF/AvaK domain-containing protein [Allosphingosinicella sp.]|jgi:uncharacterized protein (TIGR02271 family)